jgi:hypothetical protein
VESPRDASFYLGYSRGDENYLQTTASGCPRASDGFIGPWDGRTSGRAEDTVRFVNHPPLERAYRTPHLAGQEAFPEPGKKRDGFVDEIRANSRLPRAAHRSNRRPDATRNPSASAPFCSHSRRSSLPGRECSIALVSRRWRDFCRGGFRLEGGGQVNRQPRRSSWRCAPRGFSGPRQRPGRAAGGRRQPGRPVASPAR